MAPRKRALTTKELPTTDMELKPIPSSESPAKPLPMIGQAENTVMIGGMPIEIKPTKQKYQRNRTAAFYRMIDTYPLMDIMAMEAGIFGDDRDGDKAIMDWLIAATDDEDLVVKHYDSMDTGTIESILAIFKRVNRIDEKDEKLKNMERTAKKE